VTAAGFAVLGGIFGALITALSAVVIAYYQRRTALREEHRLRAFERHLPAYEKMFSACRSVQDAMSDYVMVDSRAADRSDPFLRQVLDIFRTVAYQYCTAVDWRHNHGMAYLDINLEEKCLHLRDLLLLWLSRPRVSFGDIATVKRDGVMSRISEREIQQLTACDYQELRIERKSMVLHHANDAKLIQEIHGTVAVIIKDLKAVMSH
jgi:hypothetical protein